MSHVLQVASLSWFERKAASMIYSSVPSATYQDSLDEFVEVRSVGRHKVVEVIPPNTITTIYNYIKILKIPRNTTILSVGVVCM